MDNDNTLTKVLKFRLIRSYFLFISRDYKFVFLQCFKYIIFTKNS